MNKTVSFVLCILPLILFFGTVIPLFAIMYLNGIGMVAIESWVSALLLFLFFLAFVTVIAVYGVMIWLMIKTAKKRRISEVVKVIWFMALYFLNIFVFPVYWFAYLRAE